MAGQLFGRRKVRPASWGLVTKLHDRASSFERFFFASGGIPLSIGWEISAGSGRRFLNKIEVGWVCLNVRSRCNG